MTVAHLCEKQSMLSYARFEGGAPYPSQLHRPNGKGESLPCKGTTEKEFHL
ncbi:hypothetical protein DAPPUDRAFT_252594 [Daphnia pulex]|uniref:Uncharacterized protein n=1 Tax=Daphnia pulex TaxID=6669 RepID=E9H330_DAPPU|nr:hypothetical protein DAPPUDRAFT_252594 [Daphnia pulex]|eukprot:EFX73887.1 hypothetical protein DAPPUDRAFT_252594 [Daphnia pulex]